MKPALVLLSDLDLDAPALPGICTVSDLDRTWDHGGWQLGADAARRGARWCDRPYFVGKPSISWLVERCRRNDAAGGYTQIGNEQNHPLELWGGTASDWRIWQADVIAQHPEGNWIAGPPSPGIPGWQDWVWREAPRQAVHCYGLFEQMQGVVRWFLDNTIGELFISECNPGAGNVFDLDRWAVEHLLPFLDWCGQQPRVKLVAYFAWRWDRSPSLPSSIDARGTRVIDVLTNWQPKELPMATLKEQFANEYAAWTAAGGIDHHFEAHLIGTGRIKPTREQLAMIVNNIRGSAQQLENAISALPLA